MKRFVSVFGLLAMVIALASPAVASDTKSTDSKMKKKAKSASAMTVIPLTNMLVNGKKVWLPAEVKAPKGKVKFVLNNTLDAPHGFQIPGVMKAGVVVPAGKSMEVPVDLKSAKKYELKCHMHPAHVSAHIETY